MNTARISVEEIAERLSIGRSTVYTLLENGVIPSIRLGQGKGFKYIVTRHAYQQWERTCGMTPSQVA